MSISAAARLIEVLDEHGYDTDDLTMIEVTYDDDEVAGIHLYRDGVWDEEIGVGQPGFRDLVDEAANIDDNDFAIKREGPIGGFGAERTQFQAHVYRD